MKVPYLIALSLAAPLLLVEVPARAAPPVKVEGVLTEAAKWVHGVPAGAPCTQPLQVHEAGAGVYILRENKCANFEAPFMYLILGESQALMLDSGATPAAGVDVPLLETVNGLIKTWEAQKPGRKLKLLVAHTHGHGDHRYFDKVFGTRPDTIVVGPTPAEVKAAFQLPNWPEGENQLELGGRSITVMPLPGHEVAHLAFYDQQSGTMFSGDSLYPGLLTVRDWPAYRKSIARLVKFTESHPVATFAGAHVEMTNKPGAMYELGSPYQPQEHALFLNQSHLNALHAMLTKQGDTIATLEHADFRVGPP